KGQCGSHLILAKLSRGSLHVALRRLRLWEKILIQSLPARSFSVLFAAPGLHYLYLMTQFTPHPEKALDAVGNWLRAKPGTNGTPQVFRLFGYAGTGKTTLARHIADAADGEVKFAAFTGKAASVMRGKGCRGASTIHGLIYRA